MLFNVFDFFLGFTNDGALLGWHQHVVDTNGDARTCGQTETVLQQLVGKHHGVFQTALAERRVDELRNFFLLECFVDVLESQAFGQDFGQQGTTHSGVHHVGRRRELFGFFVQNPIGNADADLGCQFNNFGVQSRLNFCDVGKDHAFAFGVDAFAGCVIQAQHHVLRRHNRRFTVGGEQHVVGSEHQCAGFHLRFHRQRHVNGHLVTVEVGVEGRANEGVQLNGFAFNQQRLERLNAQTVQSRRTVQHHGVLFDHLFQDVPHHGCTGFNFFLCSLDGGRDAHGFETCKDEWLEQLDGHQLGQTALVQLERWAHGNHRTTRVVDALTQQVLTETTALTFDHVGQRFEGTFVGAGHGFTATTVVQQ